MGPLHNGDLSYNTDKGICEIAHFPICMPSKVDLRLPLPIDPCNPSRGLWGMVDWTVFSENKRVLNDGQLHLSFGNSEYIGGPPELALLKVLAHQWGIEIEVEK